MYNVQNWVLIAELGLNTSFYDGCISDASQGPAHMISTTLTHTYTHAHAHTHTHTQRGSSPLLT
jgi:hypothetical protein